MNVYVTPPVDAKAPTAKAPKPTKPDVVVWEPKLHYEGNIDFLQENYTTRV